MATSTKGKNKGKAKPAAPAPTPKASSNGQEEVEFGVSDIAAHLTKKHKLAKAVTTRELRTLIRKMARDGRVDREIIPGNRTRYAWSGINDPEVKAIIKAYADGEPEVAKKKALDELKNRPKKDKKGKKAKAAAKAAAAEVEDDDDIEVDDDE